VNRTVLLVLSAVLAAPAWAAPATYALDPAHSFVRFSYNHVGFSTQLSRFDRTTGTIVLDAAAKNASVETTTDIKSVSTGSEQLNEHLQGADFFDTANHPTATFKSTAVHFDGERPATIDGNLTIKGVTRPVTLKVTAYRHGVHPMTKKPTIGADATAQIKRTEFNVGKYAPLVGDDVTLSIAVEAAQQ